MTAARVGPGRHRSAAADAAILGATLQILRERGYEALTVAGVIERVADVAGCRFLSFEGTRAAAMAAGARTSRSP